MILSLRKGHRWIWTLLALAIPFGFLLAWNALSETSVESSFDKLQPVRFNKEVSSDQHEGVAVHLLRDSNLPGRQIEVSVYQTLNYPALVAYFSTQPSTEPQKGALLLGPIENTGSYRFNIAPNQPSGATFYILLYDALQQELIHTFQLASN